MNSRALIGIYSLTLLLSAALLFSVQPMFSKMILPLLGGTPQVWNTAMVFFQILLLAGYAYAHLTSRLLKPSIQAVLHIILLALCLVVLPIAIPEGARPPVDHDPTFWQLSLMAMVVGGPFFVLSGSAPMLQRWFSGTNHKDADNPYFLYGASNLGSMSALAAYPFIIEPYLDLSGQSVFWLYGFCALIALFIGAALPTFGKSYKNPKSEESISEPDPAPITWSLRLKWIYLSFLPSSLMLGVTSFVTTDIASVPLIWIIPLALYVSTFIIVFARRQIFKLDHVFIAQGVLLAFLTANMLAYGRFPVQVMLGTHMLLFFTSALACHMLLAAARPNARHLTEFYLLMSFGGALGGIFNAILAPHFFIVPLEYPFVLALIAFLRYSDQAKFALRETITRLRTGLHTEGMNAILTLPAIIFAILFVFQGYILAFDGKIFLLGIAAFIFALTVALVKTRWLFGTSVAFTLLLFLPGYEVEGTYLNNIKFLDRNYFGVIRVADFTENERVLIHSTTTHGSQPIEEKYQNLKLSYYGTGSPINDAFSLLDGRSGDQQIAILGLGIGVTACYTREGRSFDFFEIDKDIADIAENPEYFTYLSKCGSPYQIILGDARLTINDQPDSRYDLIVVDAFSSDNIPAHLITQEAVALYLKKLKPEGVLIFNISNNHIDLEPVLTAIGQKIGVATYAKVSDGKAVEGTPFTSYASHFMIFLPDAKDESYFTDRFWTAGMNRDGVAAWSDRYSNIISILSPKVSHQRYKTQMAAEKEAGIGATDPADTQKKTEEKAIENSGE